MLQKLWLAKDSRSLHLFQTRRSNQIVLQCFFGDADYSLTLAVKLQRFLLPNMYRINLFAVDNRKKPKGGSFLRYSSPPLIGEQVLSGNLIKLDEKLRITILYPHQQHHLDPSLKENLCFKVNLYDKARIYTRMRDGTSSQKGRTPSIFRT